MKYLYLLLIIPIQLLSQSVTTFPSSTIDSVMLTSNFTSNTNIISISNVQVSALDSTIGIYQGYSDFPIPDGLVISTTGAKWSLEQPPGPNSDGPFRSFLSVQDPYLLSLGTSLSTAFTNSPTPFNNLVSIEFDFVSQFDVISFDYVFASREYKDFTCSNYNDIFGFFIEGPGASGPYHNGSSNLAIVPGSNGTPVCINSINSGQQSNPDNPNQCLELDTNFMNYSYLFNQNQFMVDSNYFPCPYNGFTDQLTITDTLIPDSTYHIKIVIADVSDKLLNSAVFLSANSFTSVQSDPALWGCLDTNALNYSPIAIYSDSSCLYSNVSLLEIDKMEEILSQVNNPIENNIISIPNLNEELEVHIYDINGKKQISTKNSSIDISFLESGIFILEISSGAYKTRGKFIKN